MFIIRKRWYCEFYFKTKYFILVSAEVCNIFIFVSVRPIAGGNANPLEGILGAEKKE